MATTDFVVKNGLVVTDGTKVNSTTDSSGSTDTLSSLYVAGGVAVAKKLHVGTEFSVGSNVTLAGDLAVNGGDITTTATTFNLINANATTVNFAGAATTLEIGAATGTTNINNNLDVDGDVNIDGGDLTVSTATFNLANTNATTVNAFGAATTLEIGAATGTTNINNNLDVDGDVNIDGGDLTVSTATFNLANTNATTGNLFGAATTLNLANVTAAQTISIGNASTAASTYNLGTGATTTGNTKTVNLGTGGVTGSTTNVNIGSTIGSTTTVNSGTLVGALTTQNVFNTVATTVNAFGAAGTIGIGATSGTLTFNNPTVVGTQATVNLWNTASTTVNAFGAATAVNVGANTGTATLRNPTVVGTQATVNLWNTTSTTVNAFGAATSIVLGAATGTTNIRNNLDVDGDVNVDGGDITTNATTFNLINATATAVNFAGAATTLGIGANTGTATLRNPTVVGTQATVNLWNTTSTTVNAFGAATAVNVGANTGTLTIGNPTVVGTQATVNLWNSTSTAVNFAGAATAVSIGATTGTTTINNPELRIGGSDTGNFISFRGTTGDQPGSFNHTYIGERIHAATEASELLIFKGNDPAAGSGPDRVRVFAGEFRVDTYTTAITDTFENTGASASAINRMLITSNGQVTLGANIASTTTGTGTLLVTGGVGVSGAIFANTLNSTVATGTAPLTVASTTLVTNLNADLLDGYQAAEANTVSTVVARSASGDINVRLVRSEFADQATISGAMAFRVNNSTDNFVRFVNDTAAIRTFLSVPTRTGGDASGTWGINITGNAATVTNGVYTVGDQTIAGVKTFSSTISGSINGNAATVTDGVYTTGNQTIAGVKTFSSTISGSINGNAATATNLSTNRTNWSTNGTISAVVGQLAWKNYANNHTIFDASAGTSPDGGAVNNTNAAVAWAGTYPTLMGWNGATTYGVRVDSARVADNGGVTSLAAGSAITLSATTGAITVNHSDTSSVANVTAATNQFVTAITFDTFGHVQSVTRGSPSGFLTGESDTLATVTARGNVATGNIGVPAGDGTGYCFWGNGSSYKISMGVSSLYQYGPVTDYSIKTQMDAGSPNRGFTWGRDGIAPIAALNSTSGNMQIAGTFSALSKSFLIPHPTKPGMQLRYGSLEGPENGVYVRGKLVDSTIIELPDYWTGLVDADSITVNLTAAGAGQQLYVEKIENNCVHVVNETGKPVNCFYTVYAERKDIDKMVVEIE